MSAPAVARPTQPAPDIANASASDVDPNDRHEAAEDAKNPALAPPDASAAGTAAQSTADGFPRPAAQPYATAELFSKLGVVVGGRAASQDSAAATTRRSSDAALLKVCSDGERTSYLTTLAGRYIAKGLALAEVEQICLDWNARNSPPLDEAKVASTVQSIWRTHQHNHPVAEEIGVLEPLFQLAEADISVLLRTNPPPRDYLLDNCLPLGKVGMIVAAGGTGKSQFMLQLGFAVATGAPLCGHWTVRSPGSALLLFAEDEKEEVHRRLPNVLVEHAGHPGCSQLDQRLFIKSLVGENNQMTVGLPSGGVKATDWVDRLVLVAKQIPDLRLIVIDPASRFRGGNENAADDATRFIEQLERIAKQTGATVVVAHHVNKGSMMNGKQAKSQSQADVRGSSALTDGVRWQMNMTRIPDKLANKLAISPEDQSRYLVAEVTKNNYAPPQAQPVVLYRKDGGYLVDHRVMSIPLTLEDRIVDLLRREDQAGNSYSANGVEKEFGGAQGPLKAGKNAVRDAIKNLISSGKVQKSGAGPGSVLVVTGSPISMKP